MSIISGVVHKVVEDSIVVDCDGNYITMYTYEYCCAVDTGHLEPFLVLSPNKSFPTPGTRIVISDNNKWAYKQDYNSPISKAS